MLDGQPPGEVSPLSGSQDAWKHLLERVHVEGPVDAKRAAGAVWAGLREVAARYRGMVYSMEPVGQEMVLAAVKAQFAASRSSVGDWEAIDRQWRPVAMAVARTLNEDPVSRPRLERLWATLCEERP